MIAAEALAVSQNFQRCLKHCRSHQIPSKCMGCMICLYQLLLPVIKCWNSIHPVSCSHRQCVSSSASAQRINDHLEHSCLRSGSIGSYTLYILIPKITATENSRNCCMHLASAIYLDPPGLSTVHVQLYPCQHYMICIAPTVLN